MTISEILAHTIANGGGTFDARTYGPYTGKGFVVAVTNEQTTVPVTVDAGLFERMFDNVKDTYHSKYIGTWLDGDRIYIDPVSITQHEAVARRMAEDYNQIAYFNLDTMEEIRL